MIVLDPRDPVENEIWDLLFELSDLLPVRWTLIGAQMVALHAFEHGMTPGRSSLDVDVLVDIQADSEGLRAASLALEEAGFALATVTPDGRGHRFVRGRMAIDLLAPDHMGPRANLTTIPPARTVEVPGGRHALGRSAYLDVELHGRRGRIPRPDLLGAILVKGRAVGVDDAPDDQLTDLDLLLRLVPDPRALLETATQGERKALKLINRLLQDRLPSQPARQTLRILAADP